jgi:hypothetical protein
MRKRYCRVCGEPFTARRFDALTCTSTCWARKSRGYDLAYLATLPDYLVGARRAIHEADLDVVATAKAVRAAKREGQQVLSPLATKLGDGNCRVGPGNFTPKKIRAI